MKLHNKIRIQSVILTLILSTHTISSSLAAGKNLSGAFLEEPKFKTLARHVLQEQNGLKMLGPVQPDHPLELSIQLDLRNKEQLDYHLQHLYDVNSPLYHQFLSADEFRSLYSPTQEDVERVKSFLTSNGIQFKSVDSNLLLVHASGSVKQVNQAFRIELHHYLREDGVSTFYAPTTEPVIPANLVITHIYGLQTGIRKRSKITSRRLDGSLPFRDHSDFQNAQSSSLPTADPNGLIGPLEVRQQYSLSSPLYGQGQVIGVEGAGPFSMSDINAFTQYFWNTNANIEIVLVDGATPFSGAPDGEATLDLECQLGLAPYAKILFYEGNGNVVDTYNRMASDNLATSISTSIGYFPETAFSDIPAFKQMAAQGQSFFSASGDSGAESDLGVPTNNPYVTAVGGTAFQDGIGKSPEIAWSGSSGGWTPVYSIPSWQEPLITNASLASKTQRNMPDVALVSDLEWELYINGNWTVHDPSGGWVIGGTSAAAPSWAGFMALVNEQNAANGYGRMGSLNPALYALASSSASYARDFHDITIGNNITNPPASGLNQGDYTAVVGFDDVTGLGSPKMDALIQDLVSPPIKPTPSPTPTVSPKPTPTVTPTPTPSPIPTPTPKPSPTPTPTPKPSPTPTPTNPSPNPGQCKPWVEGVQYNIGDVVTYQGNTYTCIQSYFAWPGTNWNPAATADLWKLGGHC